MNTSVGGARVTAIVVTYESAGLIVDCLDALVEALGATDGTDGTQVIVADNASADATCDVVESQFPEVRVLRIDDNRGYAAGINAAARVAGDTDALLILNPDVLVERGSVGPLLEALSIDRTGIAVPRVLGPDGVLEPSLRRESTVLRALGEALLGGGRAGRHEALGEMVVDPGRYESSTTAACASGCAMLIGSRCFEELGGFDETFFHGSEETDFCLRAGDRGWSVRYSPDAVVEHLGGGGAQSSTLRPIMFANRLELYRRRRGPVRAVAFRGALALNEALRSWRGPAYRATLRRLLTPGHPSRRRGARG